MSQTLELPNGDVVSPDDVFCYNDYPYRLVWLDDDTHEFALSPLYWGDSGMDIPFRDREALVDQWEVDSHGQMTAEEWADWLDDATEDPRYSDDEVTSLAAALPTEWDSTGGDPDSGGGILDRLGL
ncbi:MULTISPECIES: hypothetical protein [Haloarcula]|jgi:hypothetical protein|uniref:Uncharacterized protein n=1 Tax=Haloarcula marismortui ATCC 33799 TaxID=662475 RepID=M0JMX3_9EURY|nr:MULTISPECIES: hypothetical protein [Haloarcula]EMA09708.1 hypothetical protein C435_21660 [Haloarcula californiae ATCC 33799]NHN62377.1 hypothetical protein [Haloarcula sp. JP-Z28]NHX41423.1 hypothetical protein [Haloarcula sp. R1-2]